MTKRRPLRIVLDGERPESYNTFYSGTHWRQRKRIADRIHQLVALYCPPGFAPFTVPVHITVTTYFRYRPLDASNVAIKLYEDGLKGRVLIDDSPQYVRGVTSISLLDRERPRVEIDIVPVED